VANAILYDTVANVAAIPASPANNDAVEVVDSTGIESFSPLSGKPAGFVGSSGLSVRMVYTTSGSTWNWIQYFPNDPESRYFKISGGTLTGQLKADDSTSTVAPVYSFDGDADTGIAHTGANELALVTGGTPRLTIDSSGTISTSHYSFPNNSGTAGQVLTTNGSGTLSFQTMDTAVLMSPQTVTSNKTIPAYTNAGMMGPSITLAPSVTIEVGANSVLTILR